MGNTKGKLSDLKALNEEYKTGKLVAFIAVGLAFGFSAFVYFTSRADLERERNLVYVLQNGKSIFLASRENMSENRPAEIKHHISMLMGLLFTVSPDAAQIQENTDQALYLGDESVKRFIDQLKEKKYYDQLIAASADQTIKLDTNAIQLDVSTYPIKAVVKAKQQIVRISNVTVKEITCSMDLRNTPRSDNNPHGLLVENFTVISNNQLEVKDRTPNN